MTNFDFLLKEKKFESFANIAVSAEKIFNILTTTKNNDEFIKVFLENIKKK